MGKRKSSKAGGAANVLLVNDAKKDRAADALENDHDDGMDIEDGYMSFISKANATAADDDSASDDDQAFDLAAGGDSDDSIDDSDDVSLIFIIITLLIMDNLRMMKHLVS
mgnify:CR=1 FL=1